MNSNKYIYPIVYMYQASHVIYTIEAISTTWYFNHSLPVSHTTGSSYIPEPALRTNPSKHGLGYHDPNVSDQITSVPDVTIVYTVLLY